MSQTCLRGLLADTFFQRSDKTMFVEKIKALFYPDVGKLTGWIHAAYLSSWERL